MSSESRRALLAEIWTRVDPRLHSELRSELDSSRIGFELGSRRVVLVGQRAAGKSWLLPLIARWVGRPAFDLDELIEKRSGRRLADWLPVDAEGFRAAERSQFNALPGSSVVAVGGGFLGLHADLLAADIAVLVPVSFETYVERLRGDSTRPRLRPEVSVEEEMKQIYDERQVLQARAPTVRLPAFLKGTWEVAR